MTLFLLCNSSSNYNNSIVIDDDGELTSSKIIENYDDNITNELRRRRMERCPCYPCCAFPCPCSS